MNQLTVIRYDAPKPFKYSSGLYAVLKTSKNIVTLQKITLGKLAYYEDGQPNIICTGVNNKGIIKTDLTLTPCRTNQ